MLKYYHKIIRIYTKLNLIIINLLYFLNLFIKKASSFNIILRFLLLVIINKKLNNEKIYFIIKINFEFKTLVIYIIKILY